MNVVIDENSGFCFGVINAIQTAENYLTEHQTLYCLGDIVHNNEEVKRLTDTGLQVISSTRFQQLQDTTVLIRAHGEPPSTYQAAKSHHIKLIDATCPVVLRLQKRIMDFSRNPDNENTQILIFGKQGHAEVIGLMGQAGNRGKVLSTLQDIEEIDFSRPSMLYSQTTQSVELYYQLVEAIQKRYQATGHERWFQYADTICRKVANRAAQIQEFARQYNVILFVSGEKSSNGLYLYRICKQNNPNSYLISAIDQIKDIPLRTAQSVGICGATSTPMWLMQKIARLIKI